MTEVKDFHTTKQETNKTGHQIRDEASVNMRSKFPRLLFFFSGKINLNIYFKETLN
jgi:hypothetical protein